MVMFDKRKKLSILPDLKDEIFLSNQIDVRHFPDLFKIDFKQVNQQVDRVGDDKNEVLIFNRRTIGLTPLLMKQFVSILNNIMVDYEKKNGPIKVPKAPKMPKAVKKVVGSREYIG